MSGTPKSRSLRMTGTNVGSPKGREPYGDTGPVVVVRVTPHQGGREGRPQGKVARWLDIRRPEGMRNACDMRSHVRSESVEWRLAHAGDVTSGQCLGPVPAMTCVAGNGRVRSSWESPRVPVPSRVHTRGEGWEWDGYQEVLDDASSA